MARLPWARRGGGVVASRHMHRDSPDSRGPPTPGLLPPDEWQTLPSEVYLPTDGPPSDNGEVILAVREVGDGRQALPVYTALQVLGSAYGMDSPWISVMSSRLQSLAPEVGAGSLLVDAAMPDDAVAAGDQDSAEPHGTARSSGDIEPAMLYAPSRPFTEGDQQAMLELQPIVGDQFALVVFSSPELLVAGCGQYQPWVSFAEDLLETVRRSTGADVVFKDKALPEYVRHGPPDPANGNEGGTDGR